MVELIEKQSGQRPEAILAANGYCSEENLDHLESAAQPERRIEGFIATGKQKHGEHRLPCKPGPLPKGATKVDRIKRKLQTKMGKAVYAARKCVVEPVFGQIKQARGFRQFLLRGKEKVKGEWALVCLTHNILRLHAVMQPAEAHRRMFFAQNRARRVTWGDFARRNLWWRRFATNSCYAGVRLSRASRAISRTGS